MASAVTKELHKVQAANFPLCLWASCLRSLFFYAAFGPQAILKLAIFYALCLAPLRIYFNFLVLSLKNYLNNFARPIRIRFIFAAWSQEPCNIFYIIADFAAKYRVLQFYGLLLVTVPVGEFLYYDVLVGGYGANQVCSRV